jgi:hypothetical protein
MQIAPNSIGKIAATTFMVIRLAFVTEKRIYNVIGTSHDGHVSPALFVPFILYRIAVPKELPKTEFTRVYCNPQAKKLQFP